jgi:septal ring-binding cell division protein DamX
MADDGVREIQLSGKHLVFLFMTAALLLVVTFLFGVVVGRGVRAQKEPIVAGEALTPGASAAAEPVSGGAASQPEPAAPLAQPPSTPPPTPPDEDLSYSSRLEGKPGEPPKGGQPAAAAKDPKAEKAVGDARTKPLPAPPAQTAAAPVAPAPAPASAAAAPVNGEPAGAGYAFSVSAFKDRAKADGLATQLTGKGFITYVVRVPSKNVFSVRVGKYKTSKEAEAARRRLQKEGYKPSPITR